MKAYFSLEDGTPCNVTELLGLDLFSFVKAAGFGGFHPTQLHSIARQLIGSICCTFPEEHDLDFRAARTRNRTWRFEAREYPPGTF